MPAVTLIVDPHMTNSKSNFTYESVANSDRTRCEVNNNKNKYGRH